MDKFADVTAKTEKNFEANLLNISVSLPSNCVVIVVHDIGSDNIHERKQMKKYTFVKMGYSFLNPLWVDAK